MSRWWLQDCRSDAYVPEEARDEEEQPLGNNDPAQPPRFDALPPQVSQRAQFELQGNFYVVMLYVFMNCFMFGAACGSSSVRLMQLCVLRGVIVFREA